MLRHHENLYKTINITYHGKYTPYPMLSYGPYDCPLCPVKGLYHEMCNIVIACRGAKPPDVTTGQSRLMTFTSSRQSSSPPLRLH